MHGHVVPLSGLDNCDIYGGSSSDYSTDVSAQKGAGWRSWLRQPHWGIMKRPKGVEMRGDGSQDGYVRG